MSRPRQAVQWWSAAALLGVTITGCAGPSAPLDVGTQTAPIALVLGQLKAVQEAPIGPAVGPPVPQALPYYQPPAGVPQVLPPLPTLPPGPCPDYSPIAPVLGVGSVIPAPPVKATYKYRAQVIDIYPGKHTTFVGDSVWTIEPGPVDASTGAYDVTYTVKLGASVTKRVLRTLPHDIGTDQGAQPLADQTNPNAVIKQINDLGVLPAPLPTGLPNLAAYGLAGIYLVSQESNGAVFKPSAPIALLQLRQLNGSSDPASAAAQSITSVGFDPASQAFMAFRSTVANPTSKLNACGTPLQAVQVSLTSPNSPLAPDVPAPFLDFGAAVYGEKNPSTDPTAPKFNVLLFGQKIDFGLQYGGLVLSENVAVGPLNGVQVDPKDPPQPPASPPPSPEPSQEWLTGPFVSWAATPALQYAIEHGIIKMESFTINQKPKLPKVS